MTRTRILTALCLLPLAVAIYLGPSWVVLGFVLLAGVLGTREAHGLFRARGCRPLALAGYLGALLVPVAFQWPDHLPVAVALAVAAAVAVGEHLLWRRGTEGALEALAATWATLVLPVLLLGFQVALRGLEGATVGGQAVRPQALLIVLYGVVFGTDTGAYFVGRSFGRLKLCPDVSPKKTVEGFVGGLVAGLAFMLAFNALTHAGLALPRALAWGFVLSVASVLGDLSISLLKRSAGVKDTSHLLPGHGGVLDRLDGLLFAAPLLYLLVTGAHAAAGAGAAAGAP